MYFIVQIMHSGTTYNKYIANVEYKNLKANVKRIKTLGESSLNISYLY